MATKLGEGGGEALVTGPLKKELFLRIYLSIRKCIHGEEALLIKLREVENQLFIDERHFFFFFLSKPFKRINFVGNHFHETF